MLVGHVKSLLPEPIRRVLGSARRTSEAPFFYLRGKEILRDYSRHYHRAQLNFGKEGNTVHPIIGSPRDLGIQVVLPGSGRNFIDLPDNYLELVQRVSESVKPRFDYSKECSFFPKLPPGRIPEQTQDIPAIQKGEVITIQLKNPLEIAGLEDLGAPILEELEGKVYGSNVMVDKVYLSRSPISRQVPSSSWLWHYDNHPHEVSKVMIYLTDVSEESAPFEYPRCARSLKPVPGSPLVPLYGDSRVSEEALRRYLPNGFEGHRVRGPMGTMILFDNNMIHRGNIASQSYRDVLIFQVRPVASKTRPYIDPRWTGSFQHAAFNPDPDDIIPSVQGPGLFL